MVQPKTPGQKSNTTKGCGVLLALVLGGLGLIILLGIFADYASSISNTKTSHPKIAKSTPVKSQNNKAHLEPTRRTADKEKRFGELKKKMDIEHDKVEDVNWHRIKGSDNWNNWASYIYMGEKSGHVWLRYVAGLKSDSTFLFTSFTVAADDYRNTINFHYSKTKYQYAGSGKSRYWVDLPVGQKPEQITRVTLMYMSESKEVTIRFHGQDFVEDITLTQNEIKNLGTMLEYYELAKLEPYKP